MGLYQAMKFYRYKRKGFAEMTPWKPCFDMSGVSVSDEDIRNGSPKVGDMIARNPSNHADKWLVARDYFLDNFEVNYAVSP